MDFQSDYYHSMDRDYLSVDKPGRATLNPRDIGISTPPFKDQLEALQARIKQGASTIELGFTGAGKSSMGGGSTTPEMIPKWQRQAIKELAELNELRISTHATVGTGSLAGFGQRGFDEQEREKSLNEIKRAVEFAADTTQGGPVVVHLGEFPRGIYEKYHKEGFRAYEGEEKHATVYLVDKRTGKIMEGLSRDMQMPWPEWQKDDNGEVVKDPHTGRPVPVFDPETGLMKTRLVGWDFFEKEAKKRGKDVGKFFLEAYLDQQEYEALGWAKYWSEGIERIQGQYEDLKEAKKYYEELFDGMDPEDRKNFSLKGSPDRFGLKPPDDVDPLDYVNKAMKQVRLELEHKRDSALSYSQRVEKIKAQKDNAVSMEEYGLKKTANTIARAAEFAMAKSKAKKLKDPLFVAPENVFAEQYGSHPQELKKVILESRQAFVERMKRKGMSEGRAKKLAKDHIRATFDVGHANTWKKYFEGNPNKSYEQNEKDFKKWLINQVKDLNKHDIIGHVHVSDNFGYEDEHVTPGQGIAPIKEFLEEMKKAGIKDVIVEPGHQDYLAMYGGWREFGGSVYGAQVGGAPKRSWSDIEFSYFGRARTPYFVFGEYAPSQDFSLWSGTPLE